MKSKYKFGEINPVVCRRYNNSNVCAGANTYTPGRHGHVETGTGTRLSGGKEPPADQTSTLDPSLRKFNRKQERQDTDPAHDGSGRSC